MTSTHPDHLEVEDTYEVPDSAQVPAWTGVEAVAAVHGPTEHHLEATYFDTHDLALVRAGVTLRRRAGGDDAGWHLKLPTRRGRHEAHEPLGRAVGAVPKPYRTAVRLLTRGQALTPVATVRTSRRDYELVAEDGSVLARLSDDRVRAELPADERFEAETRTWREWELEVVTGDTELLRRAAVVLADAGAHPAAWQSKLARALGDRYHAGAVPQRPRPRPKGPARDVLGPRLAALVEDLRRCDPLVRRGAPDAVHRMRVAVRRLRSALATFRPLLDREVSEPLREELRWLGRRLGEARDAEVLRDRLGTGLARVAPAPTGPVRRIVEDRLGARADAALTRAQDGLLEDRYFALMDALQSLAMAPPWSGKAEARVRKVLRRRVRHDWKRLDDRVARLQAPDEPRAGVQQRDRALHEVRKAAKRVRYAAEPLVEVYGKPAEQFVTGLRRVQSVLGEHHDIQVVRAELLGLDELAAAAGSTFALGVLYAREGHRADRLEQRFARRWHRASRGRRRSWLV